MSTRLLIVRYISCMSCDCKVYQGLFECEQSMSMESFPKVLNNVAKKKVQQNSKTLMEKLSFRPHSISKWMSNWSRSICGEITNSGVP